MSKAKHTPGPWIVGDQRRRDPGCILIHTSSGESIASAWNLMRPDGSGPDTPMEANARLIAAAPDLLAACKSAMELLDGLGGADVLGDFFAARADDESAKLMAAIAKAEGGAA
jgi:hypothetical protein